MKRGRGIGVVQASGRSNEAIRLVSERQCLGPAKHEARIRKRHARALKHRLRRIDTGHVACVGGECGSRSGGSAADIERRGHLFFDRAGGDDAGPDRRMKGRSVERVCVCQAWAQIKARIGCHSVIALTGRPVQVELARQALGTTDAAAAHQRRSIRPSRRAVRAAVAAAGVRGR